MAASMSAEPKTDPRHMAAIDLLRRTGIASYSVRYSDDEQPVVWMAVAVYPDGRWEAAAGHDFVEATFRLCDQLIDGGQCRHCGRPAGFEASLDDMPLSELICWQQYDPELETFRRSCEGSTSNG
jgi:hypothetical protein